MRRNSLKIAVLATLATLVSTTSAFAGDPSQWMP
jgi:hypothetical protein